MTRGRERHASRRLAHRADMLEQLEAARREDEPPPGALEKDDVELFLQRIDLPAKRRLRHAQRPRSR